LGTDGPVPSGKAAGSVPTLKMRDVITSVAQYAFLASSETTVPLTAWCRTLNGQKMNDFTSLPINIMFRDMEEVGVNTIM
jgi:hypothetical protein